MYSLNWRPWLDRFDPAQFVALPMRGGAWGSRPCGRARGGTLRRAAVAAQQHIRGLGSRSNASDVLNQNVYEPDDDFHEIMFWLVDAFFAPDTVELSRMFARAIPEGLTSANASASEAIAIERHLEMNW